MANTFFPGEQLLRRSRFEHLNNAVARFHPDLLAETSSVANNKVLQTVGAAFC